MKKWKFNGEEKRTCDGKVLHRIVAIEDFGDVKAGDIGGWVEKEENLCGNAWVSGNAEVYGDAKVYGNAKVSGNEDNVTLSGLGSRHGTTTAFKCADGELRVVCGCFLGTLEEFAKKVEETHGDSLYGREYKAFIEVLKIHFEDYLNEKRKKSWRIRNKVLYL